MDYFDILETYGPKGCVTTINLQVEREKERKKLADKLGKKVEELTTEEKEQADYFPALDDPCDAFRD